MREEAMDAEEAIIEATRNRIRPIFMSTLTSLFGLVPLVIFPGAGSELYRGLGVVVFGGLGLSTIATLVIVPPLLAIALRTGLAETAVNPAVIDPSATANADK
jgi:HAE1 family hydrophobic/amphiphilic exporter-1